jgi:hypothetical protein
MPRNPRARTLQQGTSPEVFRHQTTMAIDEPRARTRVTSEVRPLGVRRIRLQVVDRLKRDWSSLWTVHVWLSTTLGGTPGGTQTVALLTGTALETYTPNVRWRFLTDATGAIELDVSGVASGTRYVFAEVLGEVEPMPDGGVTW